MELDLDSSIATLKDDVVAGDFIVSSRINAGPKKLILLSYSYSRMKVM